VNTTTDETQSRLLFPILQSFGGMAGGDAGARRILAAPYTPGRHDVGLTSAAESAERTFVTDRTTKRLVAVDGNGFDAEIALASEPDSPISPLRGRQHEACSRKSEPIRSVARSYATPTTS